MENIHPYSLKTVENGYTEHAAREYALFVLRAKKNPYKTYKGFGLRVARAKKILIDLALGNDGRITKTGETYSMSKSRTMDNCFENYDGSAVVWALMNTAAQEPDEYGQSLLTYGISQFLGNDFAKKQWKDTYLVTKNV